MGSFCVSVISGAGREVVVKGSDGGGGGGGGGWDMRVLLFGRARTRCTKPHWDEVCVQFGGSFFKLGAAGSGAVLDRTSGMGALPRVWRRE
jgi:hypothetical protein